MNNIKMCLLNILFLIIFSSCSFIDKDVKNMQQNDEFQAIQEFCSLNVSYFDTLLKDMNYIFNRTNGYVFDYKNGSRYRFIAMKSNAEFHYKELDPIQDSIFYNLDTKQEYFEQRYLIEIQKIKKIIIFCNKWRISEIKINKDKHYYSFYLPFGTIYYRELEPSTYDEKMCENWYFSRKVSN